MMYRRPLSSAACLLLAFTAFAQQKAPFTYPDMLMLDLISGLAVDPAAVDEALSAAPEVVATQSDLLFLAAEFNLIRRELNVWRELSTHEAPATSAYVQAVDRHLGRLLEALMLRELGGATENLWRKVDLRPDGLSFHHEQGLARGSVLDLRFLLPGTGIGIRTLGRVVHCDEPRRDGCHCISVCFLDLGDADRELLCEYLGADRV